ncbi:SCO4848 family membrane protein [Nocardioides sp. DS6]|uniref:SCO4848 family membrane protein n=1 Tax=Nocardioides eburneus TaxID=3231482 RepID=A0ABV3T4P1_9ACTN
MKLEKKDGALLLFVGVWNVVIWSNFAKNLVRTARDPEQSRPRPYYIAHAVLIVVDVVLGGLLGRLGVKALIGRR